MTEILFKDTIRKSMNELARKKEQEEYENIRRQVLEKRR